MSEGNIAVRLAKAAKEFNIGIATIVDFLSKKGHKIDNSPNAKLSHEMYLLLVKEFQSEKTVKESAKKIELEYIHHQQSKPSAFKKAKVEEEEVDEVVIKNMPNDAKELLKPTTTETQPVQPKKPTEEPEQIAEPLKKTDEPVVIKTEKPEAEVVKDENGVTKAPIEKPVAEAEKTEETAGTESKDKTQLRIVGQIDLDAMNTKTKPDRKTKAEKEKERKEKSAQHRKKAEPQAKPFEVVEPTGQQPLPQPETQPVAVEQKPDGPAEKVDPRFMPREKIKLNGPTIVGNIKLPEPRKPEPKKPVASSTDDQVGSRKKKRRRIKKQTESAPVDTKTEKSEPQRGKPKDRRGVKREVHKVEPTEEEIQRQIRETMQRLSPTGKSRASKHRREKRQLVSQHKLEELEKSELDQKQLKVTEFVTANELATMMNVPVNQIIAACLSLGLFVSINQRLDAETLVLVAEEFGYKVEFVSVEVQEAIDESSEVDRPEDLIERHPVVTVMGHVDHGKTSLLDFIRHSNVIAGEAGGITQHIGAYEVVLDGGRKITFLDTPGHEAFTAMRARGTKITDVAIIVVAADDNVMPQTVEAINHAQAAAIPIVIAINKIDKGNANVERVKEELSKLNILVEDWGGKYQSQEISAKMGVNIELLLEKVLLEAEFLNLKANPNRLAKGSVIESALDKGRGYMAKILVQNGTLSIGDVVLAGTTYGRVKAMYNERNQAITKAGPATPVLLLGLNGAPQAGDQFNVLADEREAKNIALKRQQLQREQGLRTQKHITLDEIGRRIAIGDFKELNIIVKGDVDGSVEALSDSLLKLSAEQVQVNVIHKSVGAITESDVLLASASNAIIIGFQVRPTLSARKLAESEQIDIRLYSIIYQAIDEIKAAIEGMLSPTYEEKILCNLEVRQVFKITKVGTVAGCMVLDGKIMRNFKIRLIRDGIVVYTGKLGSLKRFKDDVKEAYAGQDCGLNIDNFNDIKVNDIIEAYEMIEVKRKT